MKYHSPPRQQNQFGILAMRYYPNLQYKAALRLFRKELEITDGLMQALKTAGYKDNQQLLTRRQLKIIEDYLGESN